MSVEKLRHFNCRQRTVVYPQVIEFSVFQPRRAKPRAEMKIGACISRTFIEMIAYNFCLHALAIKEDLHPAGIRGTVVTHADLHPLFVRNDLCGLNRNGVARPKPLDHKEQMSVTQ